MYSCLPEEAFKRKVDEILSSQGKDCYQITISEFKQLCNRFKWINNKECEKQARAKAALQGNIPKKETTSESTSRADIGKNNKATNKHQPNRSTWKGAAMNWAWCKEKGKSEAAYTSHTEDKCFLKNPSLCCQLSGGIREKEEARSSTKKIRVYKKKIKKQQKELRKLKYKRKKSSKMRKRKGKSSSSDDDSSDYSSSSNSDLSWVGSVSQAHGGECKASFKTVQSSAEPHVNDKSKVKKSKFESIDKILYYDNYHINSLTNDIPISELRFGEANESKTTS